MDYRMKRIITYLLICFVYILVFAFFAEQVNTFILRYLSLILVVLIEFYFYRTYEKRNKLHTTLFIILLLLFFGILLYEILKNGLFL